MSRPLTAPERSVPPAPPHPVRRAPRVGLGLALSLSLALSACQRPVVPLVAERPGGPDTFQVVTLVVPAGWEQRTEPLAVRRTYISPVEGPQDDFRENLSVRLLAGEQVDDLEGFVTNYVASVASDPDYTLEPASRVLLAGRPALHYAAVSASKARTYVQWVTLLADGRVLVVTGTTPSAVRARALAVFEQMVASLTLADAADSNAKP